VRRGGGEIVQRVWVGGEMAEFFQKRIGLSLIEQCGRPGITQCGDTTRKILKDLFRLTDKFAWPCDFFDLEFQSQELSELRRS
jgi:hypothetical protein